MKREDIIDLWDADCEHAAIILTDVAAEHEIDLDHSVAITAQESSWATDKHMHRMLGRALFESKHPAYMDSADVEGATRFQLWSYLQK